MRYHVLGIGSIGTLISHHLRIANPSIPISLIVKKGSQFRSTRLYPYGHPENDIVKLEVEREGQKSQSSNFQLEVWHDGRAERAVAKERRQDLPTDPDGSYSPNTGIQSLVVCLKAGVTSHALSVLAPRISPSSVITLIQNGMGVYDELCRDIWPDPQYRPHFIIGTTTHGATPGGSFGKTLYKTRPGEGEIKFGIVPDPRQEVDFEHWLWQESVSSTPTLAPPPSPSLPISRPPKTTTNLWPMQNTIQTLLSLSHLSPSLLPMPHLHHEQLLKLALNSVINPLTAILGSGALPNGALFGSPPAHELIRQLVKETSNIITAYLYSLSDPSSPPPDLIRIFSPESLERRVLHLVRLTSGNTSSMAQDVSNGRTTEVKYINGFLSSLAERLKISAPCQAMMTAMVHHTSMINGFNKDVNPEALAQVEKMTDRKQRLKAIEDFPRLLNPAQTVLEEKRLELEQRRLWIEEEKIMESRRQRRDREKEVRDLRASELFSASARDGKDVPTVEQWQAMGRAEKKRALQVAKSGIESASSSGELSSATDQRAPKTPTDTQPDSTQPTNDSTTSSTRSNKPTFSPNANPVAGGLASLMDSMIGSAPRQERTWDVPSAPPTARGPVPKKKPSSSAAPPPAPFSALATQIQVRERIQMKIGPSSYVNKDMSNLINNMITSAPRQERTWEVPASPPTARGPVPKKRPNISNTTASSTQSQSSESTKNATNLDETAASASQSQPSQSSPDVPFQTTKTPSPSALDSMISSAPRAERKWGPMGSHITSQGVSASSSLRLSLSQDSALHLPRGKSELGGGLDSLIAGAPRQERTWEDRRPIPTDGGRFATSRMSGS